MSDFRSKLDKLSPEQKALLEKKLREKALQQSEKNKIPVRENLNSYPMTNEQERLWFLNQLNPDSASYNMPAALKIRGNLNISALEKSLREVINRHQVFKASFENGSDGPVQKLKEINFNLQFEDLSSDSTKLQLLIDEEANKRFDLKNGPLFRIRLIKIKENEHILLITLHHIIADGWSVGILIDELSKLYESYEKNISINLEDLPIQYFDYAEWNRRILSKDHIQNDLKYWKEQLKGMPQVLELPTDKVRSNRAKRNGGRLKTLLQTELKYVCTEISKQNNVSPFIFYLTVIQILLYRFTNQNDFGIGTPSNGRTNSDLKSLIGFFVNTIVMRGKIKGDESFNELVNYVKTIVVNSFEHQQLPFEELVNAITTEKSINHSPLFQVMFDYQESPLKNLSFSDIEIELLDQEINAAKFDLLFIIEDYGDSVVLSIEYDSDLFELSTIRTLSNMFECLLNGISKNANEKVSLIPIISDEEQKKLINWWNQTKTSYPKQYCVHQIFEQQTKKSPDSVAVTSGDYSLTYNELNTKANQLAEYLLEMNINIGDKIAIYMERSVELIIVKIAILKVGAAYVPLDKAYPIDRIKLMIDDVHAKLIISQNSLYQQIDNIGSTIKCYEELVENITSNGKNNPSLRISPESLAYIMYTSGSTGKPKGVMIPHKAIVRLVKNTNYISINDNERIAQVANTSFDAATFEFWGALLNGANLIVIPRDKILNSKIFIEELEKYKITIMILTTALFNQIVNEIPYAFKSLKTILFGGERADISVIRKLLSSSHPKNIINVYGPTENTTFTTTYQVKETDSKLDSLPIGKAISNTTVYILDKNHNIVPIGVPGELYTGGDGLAKGYFERDDLNSKSFIKNPFSTEQDEYLYKTGDLVKCKEDGNFEFIDRIDGQVKLRGFRIELGEIETEIKQINGIKDAVVVIEGEKSIDKKLTAYCVFNENDSLLIDSISDKLLKKLPNYMIPHKFIRIEEIPITPNGKVDKKALIKLSNEVKTDNKLFVQPRNKFEEYISSLWKDILGINKLSIHDNFFSLGGNSLQAAVFINRLQKYIDYDVQVQSIFLAPTISEFSHFANEYFSELIAEKFHDDKKNIESHINIESSQKLNDDKVDKFINLVTNKSKPIESKSTKNKPAVFILSPPRSGSTLLRVMLEGHEKLFSPPELDLLTYNTLDERKEKLDGNHNLWLEATIRSIMELKNCNAYEAEQIMTSFENQDMSVKEFYGQLQIWAGERMLVDKTPTYAMDINVLRKAEEYFDNPLYVHLKRHPYASIYSFIEANLDSSFFRQDHNFKRHELAELIWMRSHQNILDFLQDIPKERYVNIRFEDLVVDSVREMKKLSHFLNIDYSDALVNPYAGKRMTDPVKENSQMVGDFKFYLRNKIDTNVTNRWKNYHKHDFLCEKSISVAEKLGYDIRSEISVNAPVQFTNKIKLEKISRDRSIPLSFAQQRIWFLEQLEPGKSTYNIPTTVELKGKLEFDIFEKSLNEIIKRHESLRTYFIARDGKPEQIILTSFDFNLNIVDLTQFPISERDVKVETIIKEEANKPFLLDRFPLFRIKLICVSEQVNILMLNMHHIISDGWSLEIFVREFSAIYEGMIHITEPMLPQLNFQYADYSVWQRKLLTGKTYESSINYWRNKLTNAPKILTLPTDYNRPPIQKQRGKRLQFTIPESIVNSLKKFANEENLTLNLLFLAAFNILLYKYSKSKDILIGTPVAGRSRSELEPLIGLFVNTLVLRSHFSEDISTRQFLYNLNQNLIEALNNQDIPFEKLVDELKIQRTLSHSPLFQVLYVFNNSPVSKLKLSSLVVEPRTLDLGNSKFDLNLVITQRNNKITGIIEYDFDLFKEETIHKMISHFLNILEKLEKNKSVQISQFEFLSTIERSNLLEQLRIENREYLSNECLHTIFENNLSEHHNRDAVIFKSEKLNFNELNKRSNQLANYLIKKGVQSESIVAVCLERSIESIVSILAIWKAGGVYLPLDPTYPSDRLEYMLENSNAKLVISERNTGRFQKSKSLKIFLVEELFDIKLENEENLNLNIDSTNLAYIIYTSGSTGVPKGVMIQHKSAVNLAYELKRRVYSKYKNEKLNVSLNAQLPFDASMQQIIMLIFGNTLTIIPDEIRLDGSEFLKYVKDKEIDLLDCVPTQLKILIDSGLLKDKEKYPKIVLPGGEAIDSITWDKIKNNSQIKFFNMYGPTECTVDSTICEIEISHEKPIIGKPVNNAIHYVLDENLSLCPEGIPGELYIGGEALARGYLDNPQLTAERFIPDPFSNIGGNRIYKTGDLVRILSEGNIEFLGRLDEQIKLRGFRIELGEIESILNSHEFIRDAAAIVREDEPNDKKLVAYFIVEKGREIIISELKELLSSKLPEYMVPNFYIELEKFPLLPNKKINRKAFPKPKFNREIVGTEFADAANENENIILEIWKDILKIENIGVNDNFFELGGDSILGIQVISKANQQGLSISPKNLFQFPTIRGLASVAGKARTIIAEQNLLKGKVDLSPIQSWFFEQNFENKNHWNQSLLLELTESLDVDILRRTTQKLIEHHDVLRMKFEFKDGEYNQFYGEVNNESPFKYIELPELDNGNFSNQLANEADKIQSSLDIANGNIFKIVYFKSEFKDYILIVIHHLVIDSVSWRIILEDLQNIYLQLKSGTETNLPKKSTQFSYWTESLTKYFNSEGLLNQLDFWKEQKTLQKSIITEHHEEIENKESDTDSISIKFNSELTNSIVKEIPKKYNTKINDVLLTALSKANLSWSGARKINVTLENHGREDIFEDVDLSRTVGWFTSMYPIILDLEDSVSSIDSLKCIKEQLRKIPMNGIGYGILKYGNNKLYYNDLPHLSEISFNYLGQFILEKANNIDFKILDENKGTERAMKNLRSFQLDIVASIVNSKLNVNFIFNKHKYSKEEIDNLGKIYLNEIKKIISESKTELGGYTPSDFSNVGVDEQELDSIFSELNEEFEDD